MPPKQTTPTGSPDKRRDRRESINYRELRRLVRADLSRYSGRQGFWPFFKSAIFDKGCTSTVWMRACAYWHSTRSHLFFLLPYTIGRVYCATTSGSLACMFPAAPLMAACSILATALAFSPLAVLS